MLISMQQVSKTYAMGETTVYALDHIDLTVDKGEFVGVWGPSGSGKTTLLNLIGAIDHPTSGAVTVNDCSLDDCTDNRASELRNRFIGFVFQRYNLVPVLSAVENVMLPLQIGGLSTAEARRRAMDCLEIVGLAAQARRRPDRMSGGQQQRVAVARALIADPPLVIADEPTANLDSETALHLISLMQQINKEQGTTFIFSTHDQRLLEQVQRRIRLQDGRIQPKMEAA